MNDNNIFENAFNNIDDELIAEAKSPAIRIAARRKKIMISTIAACIAAVLVAIPSIKVISNLNDTNFTNSEDIEIIYQEEIVSQQSSEQTSNKLQQESTDTPSQTDPPPSSIGLGSSNASGGSLGNVTIKPEDLYFTNIGVNGPTTTYEKISSLNTKYLYINPIPSQKQVTVYETYYQKPLNQSEAQNLADKYFPKIANALNIGLTQYKMDAYDSSIEIRSHQPDDEFGLSVTQFTNRNIIDFSNYGDKNKTVLNGQVVSVNQMQSDEEIINSLSSIKQILFDMFDVSFDSAKICRRYYDSGISGESWLYVYFYNYNAHPLNNLPGTTPFSDFIYISFDNVSNYSGDTVNENYLYNVFSISYWSYRTENHSLLKPIAQKEILPLEKAEEYLRKGYVLAMGGCSFCQSAQTPVDFTDYDYVSFEYKGFTRNGDLALPYYAFCKKIGTAENGNMIFAKTYVPAVEVEGYEEYFVNKHNNHKQNSNSDDYILEDNGE